MGVSKSVCLLCRLKIARVTGKVYGPQWQRQYARLSGTSSARETTGASTIASSNTAVVQFSTSSQPKSPPYTRKYVAHERSRKSNSELSQRRITREQPTSRVDALFHQIVDEQDRNYEAESASADPSFIRAIGRLQEMLDGNTPIPDAYSYFQTKIYPAARRKGAHIPRVYHKAKSALLERVVIAKTADMASAGLPTVARILRLYAEDGGVHPKQWTVLVGELVKYIVNAATSPETQFGSEDERHLALQAMVKDLVDSWKVLSLRQRLAQRRHPNQWFPRLDESDLPRSAKKGQFSHAFSSLYQYPPEYLGSPVGVLAIATCALVQDSTLCSDGVRQDAAQFRYSVALTIKFCTYGDTAFRKEVVHTFPSLEDYVIGRWHGVASFPRSKGTVKNKRAPRKDTTPISATRGENVETLDAAFILQRLGTMPYTRNFTELDSLWDSFVGPERPIPGRTAAMIRQHPDIIDSFIKTRMTFSQYEQALVAWNVLGEVGLKPSLRTWNLMLDGLRKAGNLGGIRNIWAKLVRSGLRLDTSLWTTRIAGLIDCGDVEGGLRALDEMILLWENGQNRTAVEPTIAPVNAALLGLIRRKQHDIASRLITWATEKGLHPDVFTYNTILRSLIRNGHSSEEVEKLLTTMQAQGVKPDEATYVIILDSSFVGAVTRGPDDQAKIVASIASAMTGSGLQLNMQTYSKMIYILLRSNATTAALDVLNHVYSRKLEPPPHIYTMLIEHFFAQSPPNLQAVNVLLQRLHNRKLDDMDRIFYDRIIQGYARVGEAQEAFNVFIYVNKLGVRVSLSVLQDLLEALVSKGLIAEAKNMVALEKKQFESHRTDPEENQGYWSHHFWIRANMYGLLDAPEMSRERAAYSIASETL
ncbi:hypothetical protein F4777DRAFT_546993 [Nemania sp. FL0916]|nr:hypothetical protein F4777DRAFT_546993 [Nemania sp. FL0916]